MPWIWPLILPRLFFGPGTLDCLGQPTAVILIGMFSSVRPVVVVALSVLTGCSTRPPLGPSPTVQGDTDARPDPVAAGDDAQTMNADATSDLGEGLSCATLASGGAPNLLVDIVWDNQVAEADYDSVLIEDDCTLGYKHKGVFRTARMSADDCRAARAWATNKLFLDDLQLDGCPTNAYPHESFSVDLTSGAHFANPTNLCPAPAVEAVLRCFGSLVSRIFPS